MVLKETTQTKFTISLNIDKYLVLVEALRTPRKSMVLALGKDGNPELKLPSNCSFAEAQSFLVKNRDWLAKRLKQNLLLSARQNEYADYGKVWFLGELYELRLVDSKKLIEVCDKTLLVKRPAKDGVVQIERLVVDWYRNEMELAIPDRIKRINQYFRDRIVPQSVRFRKMKSSYGNCSSSKVITLNVMLMRAGYEIIDYVIAHELCHLRCWFHDGEFYSRLDSVMPDWKIRASRLENEV